MSLSYSLKMIATVEPLTGRDDREPYEQPQKTALGDLFAVFVFEVGLMPFRLRRARIGRLVEIFFFHDNTSISRGARHGKPLTRYGRKAARYNLGLSATCQ